MKKKISRLAKFAPAPLMLLAIITTLASTGAITFGERAWGADSGLVKSIRDKFSAFYGHAPQDRLYVQTDKSFYRPGETVWFTAYVRDAETLKPSTNSDIIHVELITPKGTTEKHYKIVAKDGAARGDFDLSGHPGGIYKLKAYTEWQKNDDSAFIFEKEITVQSVVMPRLKMKLDFEKKAYGKGDEVVAKLTLNTNANAPLANTSVKFKAQLAGKDLRTDSVMTDADGKVNIRFKLPADLNTIDGVVNAMIQYEGSTESVSRSIPIVLNKIKLEFFPEGGDMVSRFKSSVAFRAVNEFGKPADIEGIIVDSKGAFVAKFSSFHLGMGAVYLTPQPGETYKARITKPTGILDEYSLPEALEAGYVLSVLTPALYKGEGAGPQTPKGGLNANTGTAVKAPFGGLGAGLGTAPVKAFGGLGPDQINLVVQSFQNTELSFIAQTRGKIYASGTFHALKGVNPISINAAGFPIGITQITLFDSLGIERCERLIFVHKNKQLKISVSTDKAQYKPREQVNMTIKVTDDKGLPMPGDFSLSVVDDNLLSFADDKQGNILSKMLLEPELKEKVEEPNFYFSPQPREGPGPQTPKGGLDTKTEGGRNASAADQALDLLMMTSGWRHYVWKRILNGDMPTVKHAGEKAEIGGVVYEGGGRTPLAGATVRLDGQQIVTGNDGLFNFKGIDISERPDLTVSAPKHIEQSIWITDYGTSHNVYLYGPRPLSYNAGARGPGGRMAQEKDANMPLVAEGVPVAVNARAEAKPSPSPKAFLSPLRGDASPAPDEMPIKDIQNKDNLNVEQAPEIINDIRANGFAVFDRKADAQGRSVIFYRAKEFPTPKYKPADTERTDFASTVYWNGNVTIDHSGKAKVSFITNDLISSFRATVEGFGVDGSVCHAESTFATSLPFSMDAKIPVELVSGDKAMIPVFLKNNTAEAINGTIDISQAKGLNISLDMAVPPSPSERAGVRMAVQIPPNSSKVVYIHATATRETGESKMEIKFMSDKYNDAISRTISTIPKGFPATISFSGQDLDKQISIHPDHVVPGSMKVTFTAYPNIMGELMSGVESILREPNGCFEQTSSSNYPNIMVLQYLKSMKVKDPVLEAKALGLLDKGYKRLTSFETKETGYEWFGASPPHEALTAYGLMEFEDMKGVYSGVDPQMVTRTANLLLSRRDGEGGFKKNPRALDAFGRADEDVTNAYIVYALSETGYKDQIKKELDAVYKNAKSGDDPYVMALCANALFNVGDKDRGTEIIRLLTPLSIGEGPGVRTGWTGKKHSITRSTGQSLKVETTSLVLLALMKSPNPDNAAITVAVKFLVEARSGQGGFGSTQATILALKALTRFAEFSSHTDEAGTVELLVNGSPAGSKSYAKGERSNIIIDGLEKYIGEGKQNIEVRFKGCSKALPYSMNVSYSTTTPASAKECAVSLQTKLAATEVKVGETLRLSATLKNVTNSGQPMTMAIIGLPAGLSAQPWQLKEMQEKGIIDFYEITGNNIAFYYRSLAPNAEKQINLDLKAEIPGDYDAPASSAYLYYTNELKSWVGLNSVSVKPM